MLRYDLPQKHIFLRVVQPGNPEDNECSGGMVIAKHPRGLNVYI
jgi:hypothetical protein